MTLTTDRDMPLVSLPADLTLACAINAAMARELAVSEKVCVRPLLRRVEDRQTGTVQHVALPCGSTRDSVCPSCARKAQLLRMQQCAEGWHRTDEPEHHIAESPHAESDVAEGENADQLENGRQIRSTRRRSDVPDLPQVPAEERTIGRVFTTTDGREYRPSMFLTLTLPSYGPVDHRGVPLNPDTYQYRRAALDALHFARLVDRFWQNLRRCAGYRVQYFAAVEPQRRLAPHLHSAIRGAIPRATLRQVARGTYSQLWWPPIERPVYIHRTPVWDGSDYIDPDTGEVLPTWDKAIQQLSEDPNAKPAHVMRFGTQLDIAGIIAPSPDADRAVRYLTKYLTKAISDAHATNDTSDPDVDAHIDRLHAELRWLPCSEHCANWLRYGIQPAHAGRGLQAGRCPAKAHDRENLGIGGRRVLVSRHWSGKTLTQHKADRATVVREALLEAGLVAPDTERLAAATTLPDGSPRFTWTDAEPDPAIYTRVLLASIVERQRWRAQYEQSRAAHPVDDGSATEHPP